MRVTIISDASHCPVLNVGSYGFWAVSQRGSHGGGGVLKGKLTDSLECEAKAIVNAMHCALYLGIAENGDEVLVQTDCLNAIQYLDRQLKKLRRKDVIQVVKSFEALKAEHSLKVEFRHVKGHSRVMDQRSKAQRMSDRRSRANLEKARALAKAQ